MSRKKYFCLKSFILVEENLCSFKRICQVKKVFFFGKVSFWVKFSIEKVPCMLQRTSWVEKLFLLGNVSFSMEKNPCSLLQKDLYWVEKVICLKKFHPQLKKFHACFKDFFWIEKSMFAWNIFTLVDLFWEDKSISALKKFIFCWKISMLA